MKGRILVFTAFAILTVVYFRHTIWVPPDALLTHHLATDLYGHFVHVWDRLNLLKEGFVPLGDYWVNRGGGFPADFNDQLIAQHEFLLMVIYAIIDDFAISLRILVPMFYFATLLTAYWYGTILLKRRDASIVLAVAYAFSTYGINQLEHLELIGVQPFILLSLIFLEKTLSSRKFKYMLLTSIALFSVFLSNLYPLYFLLVFMTFRIAFHLITSPKRAEALRSVSVISIVFLLLTAPFLIHKVFNMPSQQMVTALGQSLYGYAQPPLLYFARNVPYTPYVTEIYIMYVGLAVLLLALVPMLVVKRNNVLYIFYLLVTVFFMLYAIGQYGPLNIAEWFHKYAPLAFFIQVPGRALVIGYLGLAVCAAIGYTVLVDKLSRGRIALLTLTVLIIFADLTIGFEPVTTPEYFRLKSEYQFIREQPGNFRVVEIPQIHDQQAMVNIHTGHDTIGPTLWAFGHFEPLYEFRDIYDNYIKLDITAQEASIYGVRYVIVNIDPNYFTIHGKALSLIHGPTLQQVRQLNDWLGSSRDYRLAHSNGYVSVYENMQWRGIVFSDRADFMMVGLRNPNTIEIYIENRHSTIITVSRSYSSGWRATMDRKEIRIREYMSVQQIDVPAGKHNIRLYYYNHAKWIATLIITYVILITGIVLYWRLYENRKTLGI